MADSYLNQRGNLVVLYKATSNDPDTCGPDQYWWHETGKDPTPITPEPKPDPDPPIPPPEPLPCCDDIKKKLDELKDCACQDEKPELAGSWVTTRWISDETMVHSGARLRKLFRYRSKSVRSLAELSEYWRTFTWRAGSIAVGHTGAWWGNPQVWAETEAEGKRVIRFAAAEAGLDPDQIGQWKIGRSRSPRYGMSGTMKILMKEGFPWVASRDGSNWPNELARLKPSPD